LISRTPEINHRYTNIFNDLNQDWEAIVNQRDTEKEVAFIENVLKKKGAVLDLCCGTGRHSRILTQHGWNIIGLDLSRNLLAIAKQKMRHKAAEFTLVRADMRYIPFRNHVFNAVINMFTSFGYLQTKKEDTKTLKEIQRILQKNGRFLLDIVNKNYVKKIFKEKDWAEFEPFYLLEKHSIDTHKSMLLSEWTIIKKDTKQVRHIQHNLRLYDFQKLKQTLNKTGLEVKQVYGGYDKKTFSKNASRMILLSQKSK